MSRIEKTIFGWLDLDHVLCVSGPLLLRTVNCDLGVGFRVVMSFREQPIEYSRALTDNEGSMRSGYIVCDDAKHWVTESGGPATGLVCGENMQKTIDEFVAQWKRKPWWKIWG